jgi:hypothetical protein
MKLTPVFGKLYNEKGLNDPSKTTYLYFLEFYFFLDFEPLLVG